MSRRTLEAGRDGRWRLATRRACSATSIAILALAVMGGLPLAAQDCDGDGVDDRRAVARRLEFAAPASVDVGDRPTCVIHADFDADGRVDLAVSSTRSNAIDVLLGRGDGRFDPQPSPCVGIDPRGLAAADLDGDGRVDLVSGSEGRGDGRPIITVLRGTGDGQFLPSCRDDCLDLPPGLCAEADATALDRAADAIRTVELVDLDGDGNLDAVCGVRDIAPAVSVLLGDGAGGFGPPTVLTASPPSESRYLAVGDVDLDGFSDVLSSGGELVHGPLGDGESPRRERIATVSTVSRGVALVDIDGDGRLDAVFARTSEVETGTGAGEIIVRRGRAAGGFEDVDQPGLSGLCDLLESLRAADVDGDGVVDLVVTYTGGAPAPCDRGGVGVLLGAGDGTFTPGPFLPILDGRARWVDVVDLDDDGRLDLVVAVDDPTAAVDRVTIFLQTTSVSPVDRNRNGVPDACEFIRGDVDATRSLDLSDAIIILGHLFLGAGAPGCLEAADVDDDGRLGIADPIALLVHLFRGGPPPAPPRLVAPGSCAWPVGWIDASGLLPCETSGC